MNSAPQNAVTVVRAVYVQGSPHRHIFGASPKCNFYYGFEIALKTDKVTTIPKYENDILCKIGSKYLHTNLLNTTPCITTEGQIFGVETDAVANTDCPEGWATMPSDSLKKRFQQELSAALLYVVLKHDTILIPHSKAYNIDSRYSIDRNK